MKQIKIIADTFIAGEPKAKGSILVVDDILAANLIANYKAEYYTEQKSLISEPEEESKDKAKEERRKK